MSKATYKFTMHNNMIYVQSNKTGKRWPCDRIARVSLVRELREVLTAGKTRVAYVEQTDKGFIASARINGETLQLFKIGPSPDKIARHRELQQAVIDEMAEIWADRLAAMPYMDKRKAASAMYRTIIRS